MRRFFLTHVIILTTIFGLFGCQSAAPKSPSTPVDIGAPSPGEALVYIFRPDMDQMGSSDQPTLFIDDHTIAVLGRASYTVLSLKPGSYQLQFAAGKGESSSWNFSQTFHFEAGQTQFLAVWHRDQPKSNPNLGRAASVAGGMVGGALGGGVFAGAGPGLFGHRGSMEGVNFEPVERDNATYALAGLHLVDARANHLEPHP